MSRFSLTAQQWFPLPRADVFAFFADAFQLEAITPPWLNFQVRTPRPIQMRVGRLIDYRLKLHGIPIRWRTEITQWEPPFRFEDSQLRGPYRLWQHEHVFEERDGGTLMTDRVRYDLIGGKLVHSIFVRPDLQRIFAYRQQEIPRLLGLGDEACCCRPVEIASC